MNFNLTHLLEYLFLTRVVSPTNESYKRIKNKIKERKNKTTWLLYLSHFSITSLLILVALRAAVYVSCSVSFCPNNFTCKDSLFNGLLAKFKASGFGTTTVLSHPQNCPLSCCCPESWRSCSHGSSGSVLLHTPAG